VEASWVYRQVSMKRIPYFKAGKYIRFRKLDIDRWISRNSVAPHPRLCRITTRQLEQFQTERLRRGNKLTTVNRLIATLRHMLTKALEWEMIDEEVLKRVRRVKMLPEANKRLRFLTADECRRLVACCDDHLRPIVILALNTGMRRGHSLMPSERLV